MVHNVRGIDAVLADGSSLHFGEVPQDMSRLDGPESYKALVRKIRAIAAREAEEIERRYPKVLRRVGGYNLDLMLPGGGREVTEGNRGRFPSVRERRGPSGTRAPLSPRAPKADVVMS